MYCTLVSVCLMAKCGIFREKIIRLRFSQLRRSMEKILLYYSEGSDLPGGQISSQ